MGECGGRELFLITGSLIATRAFSDDFPRQSEMIEEEGSAEDSNSSILFTTTTPAAPILSPSAIANIICGVLALAVLTVALCYLMRSFNRDERKMRVRTSLENNRRIDAQVAAAKTRAEQQKAKQQQTELVQPQGQTAPSIEYKPQDQGGESLKQDPTTGHFEPTKEVVIPSETALRTLHQTT